MEANKISFTRSSKLLTSMRIKSLRHARTIVCYLLQRIVVTLDRKATQEVSGTRVIIYISSEFFVNARAEDILNPNTVILFEILDFNHQALVYKDTDIYDKDNFYRVAWGNTFAKSRLFTTNRNRKKPHRQDQD